MSNQILIGIVSGIVASIFFTMFMLLIRPHVKISSKIAVKRGKSKSLYKIKVVNLTHWMLTNVKYSLLYCVDYPDRTTDVSTIEPLKKEFNTINKYSWFDKQASYALRLSYEVDEEKYPLNENARLEFTFLADHSISNTTTCKKVDYSVKDLQEGVFETGKSVNILVQHENVWSDENNKSKGQ